MHLNPTLSQSQFIIMEWPPPVKSHLLQPGRLYPLPFPFETIYPAETRQAVMGRVMDYLDAGGPRQEMYLPMVLQED